MQVGIRSACDHAAMAAKRKDEADVDALYEAPLAEFTQSRNSLAKRLRDAGDREGAERVKAMGKPSLPAWAINQGVRADPKAAKRLLSAGKGLRDAGGGDALREAMREEAEAVEAMTAAAAGAAEGERLSTGMVDRVRDTLRAVAGDEDLRTEFESGQVERDRKAVGLAGALGGGASATKAKRGPSAAERRKADAAVRKAQKALDARRHDVAGAAEKAEKARRAAKDADKGLADAEEAERRAREDLDSAELARDEL